MTFITKKNIITPTLFPYSPLNQVIRLVAENTELSFSLPFSSEISNAPKNIADKSNLDK